MLNATNAVIVGLIGRPLAERRTEPFALRMTGPDRSTTLDVGESIVIVRNPTIFAAWVGSDGRVMLRLLPPGGMPGQRSPDGRATWPSRCRPRACMLGRDHDQPAVP